jgi:hypothetical protein
MPEIDFSQWPTWAIVLALILNLFKVPITKGITTLFDRFHSEGESKRERQEIQAIGERQDEVALWSSMVGLQTQTIAQNKRLLDFVAETVVGDLKEIARAIKNEVGDIEKRWVTATQHMEQSKAAVTLMRMELTRLADRLGGIEKQTEGLLGR